MLDDDDVIRRSDQASDGPSSSETLSDIKIRRWLVKHVDVGLPNTGNSNGESLQLPSRKLSDLSILQSLELEVRLQLVPIWQLRLFVEHLLHRHVGHLDTPRKLVDVLRLYDSHDVVFKDFGEEVLKLGPAEIFQYLSPFWRVIVSTEIGFELAGKDFDRGGLADTVRTDETEDLAGPWCRETMEFERICGVTMGDVGAQVGRKIEDLDGFKWASSQSR